MDRNKKHDDTTHTNRDPLSGTPGAHPVGTGAGAAGGAATGAVIGTSVGGPVGFAVGGVAGAVVGGLAGKGVAEAVNPTVEDEYWRENYKTRPYVEQDAEYDSIQPAYRYGWESRSRYDEDKKWTDVEGDLRSGWNNARGSSRMAWEDAKEASRDAWTHADDEMHAQHTQDAQHTQHTGAEHGRARR